MNDIRASLIVSASEPPAEIFGGQPIVAGTFEARSSRIALNFERAVIQEWQTAGAEGRIEELFRTDLRFVELQATFEHEVTHWYQQVGTAYGYYSAQAEWVTYEGISSYIKAHESNGSELSYPLFGYVESCWENLKVEFRNLAATGLTAEEINLSWARDAINGAMIALNARRVIELCEVGDDGIPEFVAFHINWGLTQAPMSVSRPYEIDQASLRAKHTADSMNPRSKYQSAVPNVAGSKFGVVEIMEGQANMIEILKVDQIGKKIGVDLFPGIVKATCFAPYTTAWTHFSNRVGTLGINNQDRTLTFLAACDLALATPMHVDFDPLLGEAGWRDLHPGWRFLQICDAIVDTGLLGTSSLSLDTDLLLDFDSRTCEALGWPTPRALAERFLAVQAGWAAPLAVQLFEQACHLRLAAPTVFSQYMLDDVLRAQLLRDQIPIPPVLVDHDEFQLASYAHWDRDAAAKFTYNVLLNHDVHAVCDVLLRGTPQDLRDLDFAVRNLSRRLRPAGVMRLP